MHPPCTFHTHTTWSDGTASVTDMVEAAARAGFTTIGLSDHFGLHADGREVFGMRTHQFTAYVEDVLAVRARAPITVLLGLEYDYAPGGEARVRDCLARAAFDYVIGSVHVLDAFVIDYAPAPWQQLSPAQVTDVWRRYWQTLRQLVETGMIDLVGHLDLPKKFNFLPQPEPRREMDAALDAIAAAGVPIEINTAGWDKPCRDAYPSLALLTECRRRAIPVVVSDDSHHTTDLGRHFPAALERLQHAGYSEVCVLQANHRRAFLPLASWPHTNATQNNKGET